MLREGQNEARSVAAETKLEVPQEIKESLEKIGYNAEGLLGRFEISPAVLDGDKKSILEDFLGRVSSDLQHSKDNDGALYKMKFEEDRRKTGEWPYDDEKENEAIIKFFKAGLDESKNRLVETIEEEVEITNEMFRAATYASEKGLTGFTPIAIKDWVTKKMCGWAVLDSKKRPVALFDTSSTPVDTSGDSLKTASGIIRKVLNQGRPDRYNFYLTQIGNDIGISYGNRLMGEFSKGLEIPFAPPNTTRTKEGVLELVWADGVGDELEKYLKECEAHR